MENSLVSLQWEKSFTLAQNTLREYWFGINKIITNGILAVPYIPDCFNKLVYIFKRSNSAIAYQFTFYFPDNTESGVVLLNVPTQIFLPTKRFKLLLKAKADKSTDFYIMLKFLKA